MLSLLIVVGAILQEVQHGSEPMPWWVGLAIGSSAWFVIAYLALTGRIHSNAELDEWKRLYREEKAAREKLESGASEAANATGLLVQDLVSALKTAARGT